MSTRKLVQIQMPKRCLNVAKCPLSCGVGEDFLTNLATSQAQVYPITTTDTKTC